MLLITLILGVIVAFYITNPFVTVLHELGHAIAYLLLTNPDKIDIFIGSNQNYNYKINFTLGKLNFHFKLSFLLNGGGVCKSSKAEANYVKQITILLAGSFFSLLTACTFGFFAFNSEIHGALKLFCFALIICSFLSLYWNLAPNIYQDNDGKQLHFVIKYRKVFTDYISACILFNKGEYNLCAEKLIKIVSLYPYEERFLRVLTKSLLQTRNFELTEKYLIDLKQYGELEAQDYLSLGYFQSITKRGELAISNYRQGLSLDKDNLMGLNNLGYELTLNGDYDEAREILEKAIKIYPELSDAYSNLGCLEILTGELETGKQLVEKSLSLEPDNAYAFKHLGIYYLKLGDNEKSVSNFKKALVLDPTIYLQPYYQEAE